MQIHIFTHARHKHTKIYIHLHKHTYTYSHIISQTLLYFHERKQIQTYIHTNAFITFVGYKLIQSIINKQIIAVTYKTTRTTLIHNCIHTHSQTHK
jgi:hypothetical protein